MRTNETRLLAFARQTGARRYVTLPLLEQNPFRFGDQILLVAVQLVEARTATEAVIRPAHRDDYDWTQALARGPISQWDGHGRMLAVRVLGRSSDPGTRGALILQVQASVRCAAWDCEDYLLMPGHRWLRERDLALPDPTALLWRPGTE